MCVYNTTERYGLVSKLFHWIIALLVLVMLCVGASFQYLQSSHFTSTLVFIHKSTGVTILGLMVLRLLWRWINPVPQFPETMPTWEKLIARFVHYLFYVVIIIMPITGIVMSAAAGYSVPFWWINNLPLSFITKNESLSHFMQNWHEYVAWMIVGLYVLHTLAALKHHFKDHDNILKRMWL
ncbi:MAG: hypothetical protein A3I77_03350 [Gammaproteobacteria bacterium RIFCSPLOWO2_02_FULL_42_14]|nr:MAG: hypothetical protein A3B71_01330 [Gammaproteobacteria bacterium RIFCSPHIGHO2_02_FULL_42_43]OGT28148.1 MAG: hypothetical protein A2624_02055 [Gammaproteobacteria bacterium RIFCSPHIGHO2_01_FULL_42_8]OGT51709.1 MAG: hypothetical protein A3E54_03545 [Gammaproteobacteria bacterium RIFCSPHIGHO2_12_FULL_41_25]OGT61606.1 MAG: hypothetical protein A3I77_03350 [Gammaproteobacteria bacterium RIFCSPLOWO2_02_FULL_42_14]OGT86230.1 MAG: hypothetical protein A3G86_06200 [Gammaproteobacteria bacterium R